MASRNAAEAASHLAGPGYGVATLFIVMPIIDTLAQVWPWGPGSTSWRYGTVGIGANYLISFVFGMALVCAVAALAGHRRTLRLFGIAAAVCTILLLLAALGFTLDALQLRPAVPRNDPHNVWLFDTGAAKAVFKYVAGAFVMGWLALACRRGWRAFPAAREDEAPALVGKRNV